MPVKSFIAYENEIKYLEKIENDIASKHGPSVNVKLRVDFSKREYIVKIDVAFTTAYRFSFSQDITCSGMSSEF